MMTDENTVDNNTTVDEGAESETGNVSASQPDLTNDNQSDSDTSADNESESDAEADESSDEEDYSDYGDEEDYDGEGEEEQPQSEEELTDDKQGEEEGPEWYDEDGNLIEEKPQTDDKPSETEKKEQENEQSGKPNQSVAKSDKDYLSRIYEEYIPGTDEFFNAVADDARKAVEESTGEEFDQFNPQHMSRYNYYAAQSAKEREEEMKRGIEQCKREDEQKEQARIQQEKQAAYEANCQKFNAYLEKQITTQELVNKFAEYVDTNLSNRDQRTLEEQIQAGNYAGVQQIIDSLKSGRSAQRPQPRQQTPRFASQQRPSRPSHHNHNGRNIPRLSDIL